jgi:hypothetical protein
MSRRQRIRRLSRRRRAQGARPTASRVAGGAGITLAAALGAPAAAQAEDFTVTDTGDPAPDGCAVGDCSLREAVEAAEANATADRILFQAGLTGAIGLELGSLSIGDPLEVLGPGASALTVTQVGYSEIFDIDTDSGAGEAVTISGLTLSGGGPGANGAAISSYHAELTIRDSTISGNSTVAGGRGGGVYSFMGTMTIEGSTISGNYADFGGGVSSHESTTTIEGSTISGNDAGTAGGGVYAYEGMTTIEGSTISGNDADLSGGGVLSRFGTTTIEGSTISGNDAGFGGGVYADDDTTTIESSTISGNTAGSQGGGVLAYSSDPTLANTIVADNAAPDGPDLFGDASEVLFDAAFTLIGSTAGATVNETEPGSNIIGQSPQLGPLAANGGPTATMALPPTSPAVNKGSSFGATADQRGLPRPVAYPGVPFSTADGADGADIGAFELQAPAPPPPPPPPVVSNNFAFGKLKLNRRRGIALLFVRVPGSGRVVLRGPKVRRVVRTPRGATRVRLPIRARPRVRRRLLRTGRIRTRVRVTYRPAGGTPRTKTRRVRLIKKRR